MLLGNSGYRPQLVVEQGKYDLDFCEEIVKEKGLSMTAFELLHALNAMGEVGPAKVASDGRPRGITKLLKYTPFGQGNLESPSSAWDTATCRAVIKPQLMSEVEKTIDGTFVNETDGIKVKLNYVTYVGAQGVQNVIKSLTAFDAYGNHMEFDASKGDTAVLQYTEDGAPKEVSLTCTESDVAAAEFKFPDEIIGLEAGTQLTFLMKSRGGVTDGAVFTTKKAVTYLGYTDDTPYMWQVHTDGQAVNTVKMDDVNPCIVSGANIAACVGATLMVTAKDGAAGPFMIGEDEILTKSFNKVTFLVPTSKLPESLKDHDLTGADVNVTLSCTNGTLTDFHCAYAE